MAKKVVRKALPARGGGGDMFILAVILALFAAAVLLPMIG